MYHPDTKKYIYEILGLSEQEQNIMKVASGIAKKASTIAYYAKIPENSVPYMLRKLEKRHLLVRIGTGHKQIRWKSNMAIALRSFHSQYLKITGRRNK